MQNRDELISHGKERVDTNLIEVCALAKKGKFPKAYIGTH